MRNCIVFLLVSVLCKCCYAQRSIDAALEKYNDAAVPYISVEELKNTTDYALFDTRELEEYKVSHLANAHWVGFEQFELEKVLQKTPDKETPVVVYCSIGVRSEIIAKKLFDAGYENVKNLYGGIFEWKNKDQPVFDANGNPTEKVHAFSKQWGKLLTNAEKVYKYKPIIIENKPE